MPHLLFTGGGTLGPVTPLLAVAEAVRVRAPAAVFSWIGTSQGPERALVEAAGIRFIAIRSGKLRRYLSLRNLSDIINIKIGFFQSLALLRRLRPDVVVSAGGFVAVPVVWAARCLDIPVHVHAQDIHPGLANKLSLPAASSLTVAFEKSLKDFARHRPAWTGNPVRRTMLAGSRETARKLFGLEDGVPTLLVLGGGTGAAGLNAIVRGAVPLLSPTSQILHVTGKGKWDAAFVHPRYHAVEFLTDGMAHALAAADLVVTRAGIGTLTELAALALPTVIVPMPHSHQEENARYFADRGAALLFDEIGATPTTFAERVLGLWHDVDRMAALKRGMRSLRKGDASAAVAEIVLRSAGTITIDISD